MGKLEMDPGALEQAARFAEARLSEYGMNVSFTARERQVLGLVARCATSREISRALGVSPSTTKFHLHNVLMKIGAESRNELVRAFFLASEPQGTAIVDQAG
jgi:DNA-binding CsgD family transcriptional regulator